MHITRRFDKEGISLDELMKGLITNSIEDLIDDELFNSNDAGILGGIENGNSTTNEL